MAPGDDFHALRSTEFHSQSDMSRSLRLGFQFTITTRYAERLLKWRAASSRRTKWRAIAAYF